MPNATSNGPVRIPSKCTVISHSGVPSLLYVFFRFFSLFISVFWLPVLSQVGILSIIDTIGAFFGPIFGVIIADFYLIKNKNLINKDIFSSLPTSAYYYSNGWQVKGIYAVLIGFIFASSSIWNVNLNFLQSFSWIIGAFISWLTYYLLASD